jgi:hypothetical protein
MSQENDDPDDVILDEYTNCDLCLDMCFRFQRKLAEVYKDADKYLKKEISPSIVTLKDFNNKVTIYTKLMSLSANAGLNRIMANDNYVMKTIRDINKTLEEENCNYEETLKELNLRLGIINTKYQRILNSDKENGEKQRR